MAHPHHRKNDTWYPYPFSCHHKESKYHEQRDGRNDADFCFQRHSALFHIGLQMLFIELCGQKPVVQLLRGIGKAERRHQEKRHGRKDGQHNAHASDAKTNTARNQKQ